MTVTTALKERITEDMKAAMRAKEAGRLSAIRLLQAAIKQKEVDERVVADDAAVLAIIERLIKQRKDSIEQFAKAGRTDLVDKERAELDLLTGYLPQQMSEAELAAAVDAAIAESGAAGPQGMGKVYGHSEAPHRRARRHGQGLRVGEAAVDVIITCGRRPPTRGSARPPEAAAPGSSDESARASAEPMRTLSSQP